MHLLPIALLVKAATGGNIQALVILMATALGADTFLARRAAQALRDHFNIQTRETNDPCC